MGRHRKRSQFPYRVAALVAVTGGTGLLSSGPWTVPSPADVSVTRTTPPPFVPAPVAAATARPTVSAPTPAIPAPSLAAPVPIEVRAGAGDSLSSLAVRYGQSWTELWSRNLSTVEDPDRLLPGQVISLVAPRQPLPSLAPDLAPRPVVEESPEPSAAPEAVPVVEETEEISASPVLEVDSVEPTSDIVTEARSYLDVPYLWGGKTRNGLDCSGLVYVVLDELGLTDGYRTSATLRNWVVPITRDELRPGDLLFGPGHVAIYVGAGMMIDAPRTGSSVNERRISSTIYDYGRIPALAS